MDAGKPRSDHLVDAAAVEIDDLEAPAISVDAFAGRRQAVEMRQDIAGDGLVVAVLRQVDAELLGHLVRGVDTRDLARLMFLSQHTVQDHLKSIFAKTSVHSRRTLLARALGT